MDETIRIAMIDDVEAVTGLTRSAYAKWEPLIGREPLPIKTDFVGALRKHRIDILYLGPHMASLVETIRRDDDVLIENVAVAPRFQKRAYGRRMVAHAELPAWQSGLAYVRLYTNSGPPPA